jgi:DNA-binding transcriptional MerR regulator
MTLGVAQKSPEAFRTISEVAAGLDVPQHVLRFWEMKFPQVKPLKRGGGRRYYRPEDVDLLRGIRSLLYSDGLTIKGVQKLLREQGVRYVAELGRNDISLMREAAPVMPFDAKLAGSNVHPFPRPGAAPSTLAPEQRERFETLLAELLDLRARLQAAKQKRSV